MSSQIRLATEYCSIRFSRLTFGKNNLNDCLTFTLMFLSSKNGVLAHRIGDSQASRLRLRLQPSYTAPMLDVTLAPTWQLCGLRIAASKWTLKEFAAER